MAVTAHQNRHPLPAIHSLGAKAMESLDVPQRWMKKRANRKAMETGTTECVMLGLATAMPPTALVTETAGLRRISKEKMNSLINSIRLTSRHRRRG